MTFKQSLLTEIFLFQVKSKLRYPMRQKKTEIKEYREIIRNAIDSGEPIRSMQDMYDLFGDPQKRAKELMELMLETDVKSFQKERKIKKVLLVIPLLIIIFLFAFIVFVRIVNRGNEKFIYRNDEVSTSIIDGEEGQ